MAYRHVTERGISGNGSGSAKSQNQMNEYSGDERESKRSGIGGAEESSSTRNIQNKPIYLLEHLATFTVNKDSGILYPADGMRRLLQLEKTTGIWSQKMQLCLDFPWVLIMDYETENVIERFPATLIQDPTAFTSTDAMELYNNILVFIVSGGSGSRSEMHIFQSQNVSAVHLVQDLKQLRSGKIIKNHINEMNPKNTVLTAETKSDRQLFTQPMNVAIGVNNVEGGGNVSADTDSEREMGGMNDETSSTCSDKYERDVTVLNHCFDDIEKFIARLQHAAAALRELERRRRNRKSKKKDLGEGLLTIRTRPPHEKEFMDIFAKFKLSFNLLAKLKSHIHDPNAPELVHFLFTPLALIVEAANDTYYESQLPAHVINPLLTREAINLLINCVTSKETELWRSLGDAWTVPRDQWKENVGSYHPVFMDGWSPDYLVIDELEHSPASTLSPSATVGSVGFKKRMLADNGDFNSLDHFAIYGGHTSSGHQSTQHFSGAYGGPSYDYSVRSKISIDSIEHEHEHMGPSHIGISSAAAPSIHAITTGLQNLQPIHEISANQTETNRNNNNNINNNYNNNLNQLHEYGGVDDHMTSVWLEELQSTNAKIVLVTYPRTANNDKELSVVRGEYLEVLDDTRKWWKARNMRNQVGHVPHTIVTPYINDDSTDSLQFKSNFNKFNNEQIKDNKNGPADSSQWNRNKLLGKKGEFKYF